MKENGGIKGVFQFVRYVPDIVREEFVNIGVILYEVETQNPQLAIRITRDWRRVLCLDPNAPIDLLENLERSLLEIAPPGRGHEAIDFINEHFSTGIRVSGQLVVTQAKALLSKKSFDEELVSLMSMHVEPRRQETVPTEEDNSD